MFNNMFDDEDKNSKNNDKNNNVNVSNNINNSPGEKRRREIDNLFNDDYLKDDIKTNTDNFDNLNVGETRNFNTRIKMTTNKNINDNKPIVKQNSVKIDDLEDILI